MKTTYCATFIGNDHLLLKHYESGEHYGYIGGTERLASAAEELLHAACRKSGIIEQIAGSDIEFTMKKHSSTYFFLPTNTFSYLYYSVYFWLQYQMLAFC